MTVRILPFSPALATHFARLNLVWLEQFFSVEAIDREVLSDPLRHLLQAGGQVWFAQIEDGSIVGTCGVRRESPGVYELTKMAVDPAYQGRGIGQLLVRSAIDWFRGAGGRELFLESSSRLPTALALYARNGFELQPHGKPDSHYDRSDIYMIWRPAADPQLGAAR